jgi:hypothetical protein
MPSPQRTPYSRVFVIEDRAGPANAPLYMGLSRAMAFAWPQGDITPIRIPDPDQYGQFLVIDEVRGAQGLPSLPIQTRYSRDMSDLLRLVRKRCPLDLQIHMGKCQDPRDFNHGWDKILVIEGAYPTDYGVSELGALDSGEDAVINEDVPFTGRDAYELKRLLVAEFAGTEVVGEVIAVSICDSRQCGECGLPSDGCQKIFAVTLVYPGSPGLPAKIVYSPDQGATIGISTIGSLPVNVNPSDMTCVGTYLVVISNADKSIHYAPIADILDDSETWIEIVIVGAPNAIFSLGSAFTWIVGDGGVVYFTDDITAAPVAQSSGVVTNLNDIHGYDELNLLAVGAANVVIYTRNGGSTWQGITGPPANVGIALNCCWMKGENEWFVGTANGRLYYTRDAGVTWVEKTFTSSGTSEVHDISFSTPTVGYMAHNAVILRTIDGGNSWYVLPEDPVSFPANNKINSLATCGEDPNFILGGGLAVGAIDGFLVKAA